MTKLESLQSAEIPVSLMPSLAVSAPALPDKGIHIRVMAGL
jgi:hypothetical protein